LNAAPVEVSFQRRRSLARVTCLIALAAAVPLTVAWALAPATLTWAVA
jgi:hypothetical protein